MTDVTAMATAIPTAIQTGITGTSSGQTVVLNLFSGGETDFRFFMEQIRSSLSLAQVRNNVRLNDLKLHLTGGALAFFLEISTADRHI